MRIDEVLLDRVGSSYARVRYTLGSACMHAIPRPHQLRFARPFGMGRGRGSVRICVDVLVSHTHEEPIPHLTLPGLRLGVVSEGSLDPEVNQKRVTAGEDTRQLNRGSDGPLWGLTEATS